MKISSYFHQSWFSYRLYLSKSLTEKELKTLVLHPKEWTGAGIKAYPPIIGRVLSILGIATVLKTNNDVYYVNSQSFKKFFYRMFLITPSCHTLEKKIENFVFKNQLPPSPLFLQKEIKDRFRVNNRMWILTMHSRYKELQKKGYDNQILNKLNENFLVELLRNSG